MGEEGRLTRLNPQVVLFDGFWEPKRWGCVPGLVQTVAPLLFRVMVAVKVVPVVIPLGTLPLTRVALLPAVMTRVEMRELIVPLKTSPSAFCVAPGSGVESVYCHTFQTPLPHLSQLVQVLQGVPVWGLWPFQEAIQGIHCATVLL